MKNTHEINTNPITLKELYVIISEDKKIKLSQEAASKIKNCRNYLDNKILNSTKSDKPIYGVNTGFGSLCNNIISNDNLEELQKNLVVSHACGYGDEVPVEIVKLILLLKIKSLSYGNSGVQLKTVNRLIEFYNNNIIPVVYQQGSLGASGDLAPLAHLSLPLLGLGEVYISDSNGSHKKSLTKNILKKMGWDPLNLKAKEGLALLNGTQFMTAYALWSLFFSYKLSYLSDLIASCSLDAFDCRNEPFNKLVHLLRPHNGQINTAKNIRDFLEGSDLFYSSKKQVQDPYSFRCIPQVHGATKDAIKHVSNTVLTEVNSVTDNPNIIVEEDQIISAGNFHGQPLALTLDYLAIALSELGNISERRTYLLNSGQRGLPSYLIKNSGLHSGFMITQYTAASIVSQNKQLCTPASIDSIVSSNGQEDHVSMGANSATKLYRVVENLKSILAIELMNASQGLFFRKKSSSDFIESFLEVYRQEISFLEKDRILHDDIHKSVIFLNNVNIDQELLF